METNRMSSPPREPLPVTDGDSHSEDDDRFLGAFLSFLDESMRKHPELVRPMTAADVAGLQDLLDGIEVDLDEPFGDDDYVLP
jgi:hypothetical protein